MTLFYECSWAQIVLFEIGALFQFIAACAFVRERLEMRNEHPSQSHSYDDEEDCPPQRHEPSIAQQVSSYRVLPAPTHDDKPDKNIARAADLLKTAKVKFKQSFKSLHHE